MPALAVAFANHGVEIGEERRVDRGLGGLALLDRVEAALGKQTRHGAAVALDQERAALGAVVGAGRLADALEGETIARDGDAFARVHGLDQFGLPRAGGGHARDQDGDAEMRDRHAVSRARQAARAGQRVGEGRAEQADALRQFHERAGRDPSGQCQRDGG